MSRPFRHDGSGTPAAAWRSTFSDRPPGPLVLPGSGHAIVVAAHPDDETLGAGGLLTVLGRSGWRVDVVCATRGERSHPDSTNVSRQELAARRTAELTAAVRGLAPAARLVHLDLPDGDLAGREADLCAALVELVDRSDPPALIGSPWRYDGDPDHEALGRAAATVAARTDSRLLEFPIWFWHWAQPEEFDAQHARLLILDDDTIARKARAIDCHQSQLAPLSDSPAEQPVLLPGFLEHFRQPWELFFEDPALPDTALDRLHADHRDPWDVSSWYERRKRAVTLAVLQSPRYRRALEVGCSIGALAEDLAQRSDSLIAIDNSPTAVAAATARLRARRGVDVALMHAPGD